MKATKFTKETINEIGLTEKNYPEFNVGDTIAVSQRVTEGNKERLQIFEGDVIAMSNNKASTTFTVRKISANSVPVERIYPFYSPIIEKIEVVRKGKVRRAKLFYVRDRVGKAVKLKEKLLTKDQKEQKKLAKKEVKREVVATKAQSPAPAA